jgi:hypothetical protein
VAAVVLVVALALAVASPAGASNPARTATSSGTTCGVADVSTAAGLEALACRTVTEVVRGVAAMCRMPLRSLPDPAAPDACAAIDGRKISAARLEAYQSSWTHRALTLQRGLDVDVPLLEAQLPHTHNSFNSSAYEIPADLSHPGYYPTLTNQDPNQVYTIAGQLDMDVRAIEMDVHWVPSPFGNASTGGYWVTLCHGDSGNPLHVHVGCTIDRPFQDGLDELAGWLHRHPDQFVLLYLENQLGDSAQAHQVAGALIRQHLGSLVEPTSRPCAALDYHETQASILAAHHQIAIVGDCGAGAGTAWGAAVHERGLLWDEHGDPTAYSAAQCAADSQARASDSSFRRYFEDSTFVAAAAGTNPLTSSLGGTSTISAEGAAAMTRCGVNIIGFDQLTPEDPRLTALVWSWAPNEPRADAGACAYQGSDGRFHAGDCQGARRVACQAANGAWTLSTPAVAWPNAARACPQGTTFAVPRNGFRNAQLVAAKGTGGASVWLAYHRVAGTWAPA